MQRKGYVPGAAALLAVLLTACSGGSGLGESPDDSKPGEAGSAAQTAEPGKYRTLPDPCRAVDHGTLDGMLPGIKDLDEEQRDKAYEGSRSVTYDTDRRVGCGWKVESADATHHLDVDFERVVSYDGAVSDDSRAGEVYGQKEDAAELPAPSEDEPSEGETGETGPSSSDQPSAASDSDDTDTDTDADQAGSQDKNKGKGEAENGGPSANSAAAGNKAAAPSPDGTDATDPTGPASSSESPAVPEGLEPRVLDDLGDEAFLDDQLTAAGSTARHRTVTVVFRTSNVVVTIQYDEQPARGNEVPDSKELQDKARELAGKLAERFAE
ncbi:DUF3558 domain-containing protein [Streptomyces monticola]|uniref:DUF3558 domain-containing protein n=1 Tax=Streptomyces monticola TaxID=2666263 RepID=A0ABW2JVJ4_9ACTN